MRQDWKFQGFIVVILAASFLLIGLASYAVEPSASSHRLNNTLTAAYLEHGQALQVTNNCGKDIFIPANTAAEWSDFENDGPSCTTRDPNFIECIALPTNASCTGTTLQQGSTGGETWANCRPWCEQFDDGTCCQILSTQDDDCRLTDGSPTGVGAASGSCTDYD